MNQNCKVNKDLNHHQEAIKEIVDSFRKMCDYIGQNDNLGCGKCPIYNECFKENKHENLHFLMQALDIKR